MTLPGKTLRRVYTEHDVADAAYSPDGKRIAISADWTDRDDFDNWDIGVMSVAGGPVTRLTTGPADEMAPTWSPEGRNIAFSKSRVNEYASSEIYRIAPQRGAKATLVAHAPTSSAPNGCTSHGYESPKWHPSKPILLVQDECSRKNGLEYQSKLINATTGKVMSALPFYIDGGWSPAGQYLAGVAYNRDREPIFGRSVVRATPAGKVVNKIATPQPSDAFFNTMWSPDGRTVAYTKSSHGVGSIWVASAAGGTPTRIITGGGVYLHDWR